MKRGKAPLSHPEIVETQLSAVYHQRRALQTTELLLWGQDVTWRQKKKYMWKFTVTVDKKGLQHLVRLKILQSEVGWGRTYIKLVEKLLGGGYVPGEVFGRRCLSHGDGGQAAMPQNVRQCTYVTVNGLQKDYGVIMKVAMVHVVGPAGRSNN